MNFAMNYIKIKSNWFDFKSDVDDFDNKFKKMEYKGFFLYITLFKFRIFNQECDYTFVTSIKLLKKETNYTKQEILDLLKLLSKLGVIKITNVSNWAYLIEKKDGKTDKIRDKDALVIIATDMPLLSIVENDSKNGTKEVPVTSDDFYISISLELFQEYFNRGLSEKYFPLFCLISRLSNHGAEKKAFMSIERMSKVLDYDKNVLHKMILEMNRKYLLYSRLRGKSKKGKFNGKFEHHIAFNIDGITFIEANYKESIDAYVNRRDKKAEQKRKTRLKRKELSIVKLVA